MRTAAPRALVLAGLWLAAAAGPLSSDPGPHVRFGWGDAVRLRHLFAAGPPGHASCFLRIRADGGVDCARGQSALSLLEIRAVDLQTVAIKGVQSARYLCMGAGGRMLGQLQYSAEDCTFLEQLRDHHTVYLSRRHQLPVSLSATRQRQPHAARGPPAPSHFLPMLAVPPSDPQDPQEPGGHSAPLETDNMDPFGLAGRLEHVDSPSFQE